MNFEFHYYAVYIMALEAGFSDDTAWTIAVSSQEVDASMSPVRFNTSRAAVDILVTQNYTFWDDDVKRSIYLPFHFVPGDVDIAASRRIDGKRNQYLVTPNSDTVKELFITALKEKDPYMTGIAAHAFADSWAHQNFCGLVDDSNAKTNSSLAELPPAGHLQIFSMPDTPCTQWRDGRLIPAFSRIDNNDRFAEAAKKLFRYFRVYLCKQFLDDELVVDRLRAIWNKPDKNERLSDYIIGWGLRPYEPSLWRKQAGIRAVSNFSEVPHYDKIAWLAAQITKASGLYAPAVVQASASFYEQPLFFWNEAAFAYRERASELFRRKGLLT